MSFENILNKDMSRRSFLAGTGAVLLGGAALLEGDGGGITSISQAGGGNLLQAQALGRPEQPKVFNPWEPGETVYGVPNDRNWITFRDDDGLMPGYSLEMSDIFIEAGYPGVLAYAAIANSLPRNADIAKELLARGHEFVVHSLTHAHTDDANNAREMEPAFRVFQDVLGIDHGMYGSPGLVEGRQITAEAVRLGKVINATRIFLFDTNKPIRDEFELLANFQNMVKPYSGANVVVHGEGPIHGPTRRAIKLILQYIRDETDFMPVKQTQLLNYRYNRDGIRDPAYPVIYS